MVVPATVACAVCGPAEAPSTHWVRATPAASAVVAEVTLPPPLVTAQATCAPGTGFPAASRTITANESSTTEPTTPATTVSPPTALAAAGCPRGGGGGGGPAVAGAVKVPKTSAWPVRLSTARASSCCGPATPPSVQRSCAIPSSLVIEVPANTWPPPAVTTKFTTWPFTTWPLSSVTFTTSGCGSSVLTGAVCVLPVTTSRCAAGPAFAAPVESEHAGSARTTPARRRRGRERRGGIETLFLDFREPGTPSCRAFR